MSTVMQAITQDLRSWILKQIEAGCRPEDVLTAMKASGWEESVALQALRETVAQELAAEAAAAPKAPEATTTPTPQQPAVAAVTAVAAARNVPEPGIEGLPSAVMADGHEVRVLASMREPRVVVFGGFLTDTECAEVIALAAPRLERSQTVGSADASASEVHAARTSDGMFFTRGEKPLIQRIEARIAELLRWPVEYGEGLQILRYRPGSEYRPHYDYFDPAKSGTPRILERGGQRVGTLVIYLNTPAAGGATTFPDVKLEVAPVRGNAVFFSYDKADPSTRTLHAGSPVIAGEKWVATKWLREGVFV
jgi:prolyl 4-hydroxylase